MKTREYENHEYCIDVKCRGFHHLEVKCTRVTCTHSARGFHRWLDSKGFSIAKPDAIDSLEE